MNGRELWFRNVKVFIRVELAEIKNYMNRVNKSSRIVKEVLNFGFE